VVEVVGVEVGVVGVEVGMVGMVISQLLPCKLTVIVLGPLGCLLLSVIIPC
jgi:hypothetical protein